MTKKKSEPNPIEEAIGDRTKTTKDIPPIVNSEQFKKLAKTQDEPSPQEMLTLEELNRQTEERLQDQYQETPQEVRIAQGLVPEVKVPTEIPVLKPDPQPATKTSSPESPPQKAGTDDLREKEFNFEGVDDQQKIDEIDEYQDAEKHEVETAARRVGRAFIKDVEKSTIESLPDIPAEDVELTALRKYILEDGFVLATVAFHIVSLCAQPMTTPSTTTWDFKDRASIPDMVLALLNQPGYLEGIWPSLRIVMGSNKGNAAWTAGIATTIAFFDVIRTLPAIVELKNV